jgi:hypothetical protein
MREIHASNELVARCGLYCGACRSYLNGKCEGCLKNEKASWCKIRPCCAEKEIATCAECAEFPNPLDCKKFNNFVSKVFGFVFNSDRAACIAQIKRCGLGEHAKTMTEQRIQTIRRRRN